MSQESDKLTEEAKDILHHLLLVPKGFKNTSIDRLIDCLVLASVTKTFESQYEAACKNCQNHPNNGGAE
jgi:hypothetical protein